MTSQNYSSAAQIKHMGALMAWLNIQAHKDTIILSHTNGRTSSRKDMYYGEAAALCQWLQQQYDQAHHQEAAANEMRRKIISKARRLKWELPTGKADMLAINNWCMKYGYLHKPLNQYTYSELPKLVSQFSNVAKSYIK